MKHQQDDVDALLNARAEIDEQLRRHKKTLTVLFTDVAGSTSFFERNGDTAGLAMIHRHDELAGGVVEKYQGRVIKTIGDSAMAEFSDPSFAVRAGVEIQRQFLKLNQTLPQKDRVEIRIGIHTGVGYHKGNDLFGDVVNLTARIVKRTAPAQILISRAVYEAVADESDLNCQWLSKFTLDGRVEKEDLYEVVWAGAETYREVRERLAGPASVPPRYEVLSQVGAGGTGVVYKVRDLETDEIVALKILKPEIASDPAVHENFKRELCLSCKITHKNVCRIHDFSRSNGTAYASMEFVEGESLLAKLNRAGSLPVNQALEIARQACAGLREAHAQGIVHRDLKPANLMLDRSGTVKIMDFGVARLIHSNNPMTGTIVGTPAYMAPEQAELKPVSACTDIYALGLVLYEMITGTRAFCGDTPVAIALKQIQEYPTRPREIVPKLSAPLEAVILKCIQKDPAKRYQSVEALAAALQRAATARPVAVWQVSLGRKLRRAELCMRQGLQQSAETARAYIKRQDWRALAKVCTKPAALVVPVFLGGVIAFAMHGGARRNPHTPPPSSLSNAPQSPVGSPAGVPGTNPGIGQFQAPNAISVITWQEVDLNRTSKTNPEGPQPQAGKLASGDLGAAPATPKEARLPAPRIAKAQKASVSAAPAKKPSVVPVAAQTVVTASAEQPELLTLAAAPQPTSLEATSTLLAPPDTTPKDAISTSAPKPPIPEPKSSAAYLEVGSFKEESWASNAVDKLTQLGFRAFLIHKNFLWSQSYRVQVGPFADPKELTAAREKLASEGFKSHPVN